MNIIQVGIYVRQPLFRGVSSKIPSYVLFSMPMEGGTGHNFGELRLSPPKPHAKNANAKAWLFNCRGHLPGLRPYAKNMCLVTAGRNLDKRGRLKQTILVKATAGPEFRCQQNKARVIA